MEVLRNKIQELVKELFQTDVVVELTRPDEQFGDFSTNVAMKLAKDLGKNPREIAQELTNAINEQLAEYVLEVAVAGPGFINLKLTESELQNLVNEPILQRFSGQKVLVEYSDPNPFKPLHAGHLYTTLVGDVIARLVDAVGGQTVRINYGGDVGLHVGKSMWSIVKHLGGELPEKLADIPAGDRPSWLGQRYVEGNNAYEDDENAKTEIVAANKRVYELHNNNDHESAFAQIYWTCRQWSYDYFAVLYDQLQVRAFDRYIPESEVTPLGLATVKDQLSKGVYEQSDGAVIFDGEKYGLHKRVFINSEGLPTYETKDVGLSLTKWADYHFDKSIIITANEQDQYMQVVIKSIEQFEPEPARRTQHITHGMVKLQGGIKMSSRKGNVVTALEILDSARKAGESSQANTGGDTILAAVKYAFARSRVGGDIVYDPIESVALEGNSGPYLQYAHARARSILEKSEITEAALSDLQDAERSLLRKIGEYTEVVDKAVIELMPHHICTYPYELAQTFNRFYEHNRVIDDPRQGIRVHLVHLYADRLRDGLSLLGITAPDRM
jgi:arginyl-tRNA synthetase